VHEIDIFRWVAGEVTAVQSFAGENVISQCPYPDLLQSMFWFENGALGSILHTQARSATNVDPDAFAEYGHQLWFDVVGTAGSLKADIWAGQVDVYHIEPSGVAENRTVHFARREDYSGLGFHRLGHDTAAHMTEFLRRILAGEPAMQSPEDTLKTMALTFAAEESVRTGERVAVRR